MVYHGVLFVDGWMDVLAIFQYISIACVSGRVRDLDHGSMK